MRWWLRAAVLSLLAGAGAEGKGPPSCPRRRGRAGAGAAALPAGPVWPVPGPRDAGGGGDSARGVAPDAAGPGAAGAAGWEGVRGLRGSGEGRVPTRWRGSPLPPCSRQAAARASPRPWWGESGRARCWAATSWTPTRPVPLST